MKNPGQWPPWIENVPTISRGSMCLRCAEIFLMTILVSKCQKSADVWQRYDISNVETFWLFFVPFSQTLSYWTKHSNLEHIHGSKLLSMYKVKSKMPFHHLLKAPLNSTHHMLPPVKSMVSNVAGWTTISQFKMLQYKKKSHISCL